jgi:hypothetical protein
MLTKRSASEVRLGATVGSLNGKQNFPLRGGKYGWQIAGQTLKSGKVKRRIFAAPAGRANLRSRTQGAGSSAYF